MIQFEPDKPSSKISDGEKVNISKPNQVSFKVRLLKELEEIDAKILEYHDKLLTNPDNLKWASSLRKSFTMSNGYRTLFPTVKPPVELPKNWENLQSAALQHSVTCSMVHGENSLQTSISYWRVGQICAMIGSAMGGADALEYLRRAESACRGSRSEEGWESTIGGIEADFVECMLNMSRVEDVEDKAFKLCSQILNVYPYIYI